MRIVSPSPAIVLVDPLSSGMHLKEIARAAGYKVIALITMPLDLLQSPKWAPFAPHAQHLGTGGDTGFDGVILERDMARAAQLLRETEYDVRAVIPTSEGGVEFSDTLAIALGLPSNDPLLAGARRDKALMKEAARRAGLRTADFARVRNREEIDAFLERNDFPVIVKTPAGSGTSFVFKAANRKELLAHFETIMASRDIYSGLAPECALLEEFLDGPEYIVNLFGDGREIHVTDIWLYEKKDNAFGSNLYYKTILQPLYSSELAALREYTIALSKAVGVVRGPLHAEIKIDRKGPVMIEIAARLCGLRIPRFTQEFSDFDPYQASLEAFTAGRTRVPERIRFSRELCVVSCISETQGELERFEGTEEIRRLPSYHQHAEHLKDGEEIRPTASLHDVPMTVWLAGENPEQIRKDSDEVHRLFSVRVRGRQPAGLLPLTLTVAAQRFSLYGVKAIILLFVIKALSFTDRQAGGFYGLISAGAFLTPMAGGYLADRWIGYYRAVLIGCALMCAGPLIMSFESPALLYAGSLLFVLGSGLFEPSMGAMIGRLYPAQSRLKEAGFTFYFAGINAGALLAPLICGYVASRWGWGAGFATAAAGALVSFAVFTHQRARIRASAIGGGDGQKQGHRHPRRPLNPEDWSRIRLIFTLAIFMAAFTILFEQGWSSITLVADRYVRRGFGGIEIPAPFFQSVNPLIVILISPLVVRFFARLRRNGREPGSVARMAWGLAFMGIAYAVMAMGARTITGDGGGNLHPAWLVACLFLATLGELQVTPVGLSLVSRLAPAGYDAMMLGFWTLSWALGNYLSGLVAGGLESMPGGVPAFFTALTVAAAASALALSTLVPRLQQRIDRALGAPSAPRADRPLRRNRLGVALRRLRLGRGKSRAGEKDRRLG